MPFSIELFNHLVSVLFASSHWKKRSISASLLIWSPIDIATLESVVCFSLWDRTASIVLLCPESTSKSSRASSFSLKMTSNSFIGTSHAPCFVCFGFFVSSRSAWIFLRHVAHEWRISFPARNPSPASPSRLAFSRASFRCSSPSCLASDSSKSSFSYRSP